MNRRKKIWLCAAALAAGIAVWLGLTEYLLGKQGIELRTFAQEIKGIYVWLLMPFIVMLCFYQVLFGKKEGQKGLRRLFVVLISIFIVFVSFLRGAAYVLSDDLVEETVLEDGRIRGRISGFPVESYDRYYEPVWGICRRPFTGYGEEEMLEKLTAEYGEGIRRADEPEAKGEMTEIGEKAVYQAPSIRVAAQVFYFQVQNDYGLSNNFQEQLLKSDTLLFWGNRGREYGFMDESTGLAYGAESEKCDTKLYPELADKLIITCGTSAEIRDCAADLADWLYYAGEDERYFQDEGCVLEMIWIQTAGNRFEILLSGLEDKLREESWDQLYEELVRIMEDSPFSAETETGDTENGGADGDESGEAGGGAAGEADARGSETEEEPALSDEEWSRMYLSFYIDNYEKECMLEDGKTGYRIFVLDAFAGSRLYGLMGTKDGGATWELISRDPFKGDSGMGVDFTFLDEKFGFAALMHNGGDSAELYVTEDGGHSYQAAVMQGLSVTLEDGYTYNPYDYPGMPYEEDGHLYVLCGQGADGDYEGGDEAALALYESTDHGHTFVFKEMLEQ